MWSGYRDSKDIEEDVFSLFSVDEVGSEGVVWWEREVFCCLEALESPVHSIAARNSRSSASSVVVVGFEGGGDGSCKSEDGVDCTGDEDEGVVFNCSPARDEEFHHQPIVCDSGLVMCWLSC